MALTVVITGASRGIGKALAQHFAAAGYELLLSARQAQGLEATINTLREQFPGITKQATELGRWCLSFSAPDILINNAGFFQPGSLADEPMGQLENQLHVNVGSAYHLTRALLPSMLQRGTGHIFNICSIASLQPYPNGGSYSISKYALHGFTQNLREELKPTGIKVTGVYPGAVLTDSWGNFDNSSGRIMETDDVAKMVVQAAQLSPQACVEQIVLRPRLGDL